MPATLDSLDGCCCLCPKAAGKESAAVRKPPNFPTWTIPAVLMLATTVSILATDLYTPSLPTLARTFGVPAETVQLTMTLNLAGFAFGQLLYGPLSDRFGRRPVMLAGVALFMLSSAACALAWSIESLIVFRVFQGLTAACEAVICWAVIKELYGEKDGVRVVAIFSMVIAVAPAVGPVIGSQMLIRFGWESNFWLLTGLALTAIVALFAFLRETATPDRRALQPGCLIAEARRTVRVPAFWLYSIGPAAALGGLFAFVTEGPFVLIDQMGLTPDVFGYHYAAVVAAFIATNLTVNRIAAKVEGALLLRIGSVLALTGGALAVLLAATGWIAPWSLCVAAALFVSSMALVYAVAPLKALASTDASTGMASSIRGCMEMLGAMLGSAGVSALHDGTHWPLVIVMAVAAVCMALGNWGARRVERGGSPS